MSKVLVSWVATKQDFINSNENSNKITLNENGPHLSLYKEFGNDFDIHYLLSQHYENENSEITNRLNILVSKLRHTFQKQVQLIYMDIDDVLSIGTIKNKIDDLIKFKLKEFNVEVFISPGTPSMQTAWYLLGCELYHRSNITFFRRREQNYNLEGIISPKEIIHFNSSNLTNVVNIRDNSYKGLNTKFHNPFISLSYETVYTNALLLASNNKTTILIQGDEGTGKNFLASYIHYKSNRANKPLVKVNCGAYQNDELEKILFGYEKGAFSNATQLKTGALEQAKGGTLVLEEIDLLPTYLQKRLNNILGSNKIKRIGAVNEIELDIRLIVTTTKDLWNIQNLNLFQRDLYFRLAIADLKLPSFSEMNISERKNWINYFMETTYTKLEQPYISKITEDTWDFLLNYPFLGNLKEVENLVETFYTFCKEKVTFKDIPKHMIRSNEESNLLLETFIKKHIQEVVNRCSGNITQASKFLGTSRVTVSKYLK